MSSVIPFSYQEIERVYAKVVAADLRSLAVTAAESGDGVTTLASAIAERAAHAGRRTLLADLGYHRQDVETASAWSIEELLDLAEGRSEAAASSALVAGPEPQLWRLGRSRMPGVALALRDPAVMRRFVARLEASFDLVIVDASPVLAVNAANVPAETVMRACSGGILVVSACRTPLERVAMAHERLVAAAAPVIGCVLNDRWNPKLSAEICRETRRLDRVLPVAMARLRRWAQGSTLLSAEV